jgi:hypothetical protein
MNRRNGLQIITASLVIFAVTGIAGGTVIYFADIAQLEHLEHLAGHPLYNVPRK